MFKHASLTRFVSIVLRHCHHEN